MAASQHAVGWRIRVGKILHRWSIATTHLWVLMGLAAVAALGTTLGAPPAQAQSRPDAALYTVRAVPVRAEAATVVAAKAEALQQGQVEALRILLERLTLPEDHDRLPSPPAEDVEQYVLGLSIDDERTPPRGYVANLTVSFIPQAVQGLLQQANVPFTDQRGRRLVVVPVWQGGLNMEPVLWEDPNPWREAWANRRRQGLVPLEVPLGDLDDVATIDVERALEGDASAVNALADRYSAAGALIAVAQLEPGTDGAPDQIRIEATEAGAAGGAEGDERFTAALPIPADQPQDEALTQALAQGIRAIARQVDEAWKSRAVGFSGATAQLTALVPLNGRLDDWLEVRRRLDAAPAVRETKLQALTRDRAQITVLYGGEPDRLVESLTRHGLSLTNEGGYWTVRVAGSGATSPLQVPQQQQEQLRLQPPDLTQPSGTLTIR